MIESAFWKQKRQSLSLNFLNSLQAIVLVQLRVVEATFNLLAIESHSVESSVNYLTVLRPEKLYVCVAESLRQVIISYIHFGFFLFRFFLCVSQLGKNFISFLLLGINRNLGVFLLGLDFILFFVLRGSVNEHWSRDFYALYFVRWSKLITFCQPILLLLEFFKDFCAFIPKFDKQI